MANGDEQNLNYQRETVRILREQTDALKEQQTILIWLLFIIASIGFMF